MTNEAPKKNRGIMPPLKGTPDQVLKAILSTPKDKGEGRKNSPAPPSSKK